MPNEQFIVAQNARSDLFSPAHPPLNVAKIVASKAPLINMIKIRMTDYEMEGVKLLLHFCGNEPKFHPFLDEQHDANDAVKR